MGATPPVPAFVVLSEAASRFPTLGIKCSHVGNQTFPRWEKFQALMARAAALAGVSISILLKIPPSLNKSLETRINTSVLRDEGFSESLPYPSLIPPMILHILLCINSDRMSRFHFMMLECHGRDDGRDK